MDLINYSTRIQKSLQGSSSSCTPRGSRVYKRLYSKIPLLKADIPEIKVYTWIWAFRNRKLVSWVAFLRGAGMFPTSQRPIPIQAQGLSIPVNPSKHNKGSSGILPWTIESLDGKDLFLVRKSITQV
jgi:hypothetical protein